VSPLPQLVSVLRPSLLVGSGDSYVAFVTGGPDFINHKRDHKNPVLDSCHMQGKDSIWLSKSTKTRPAVLYIYGVVGSGLFSEGVEAKQVAESLSAVGKDESLEIRINSPGGSVPEGIAILNLLKRHAGHKTVYVDGLAASIAGLVAMAGDTVIMPKTALFMAHSPWTHAAGNAEDLRTQADVLDKWRDAMTNAYADKTKKSAGEIQSAIFDGKDHWYSAAEALAFGFIDKIDSASPNALLAFQESPDSVGFQASAVYYAALASNPKEKTMTVIETPAAETEPTPVAAAVPAPVDLPDLDAVKAEIEAKAATEIAALRAEIEARAATAEAAIAQARADAEAAQARLATEVEAREVREATEAFSKAFANLPGKAEDTAKALRAVARANPEAETQIRAVLASVNGILANAKVVGFEPMGGTGIVDEDPEAKVARLAAEKRKTNPSLTIEQARAMVYDENRELLRATREKD
jgi:ATP-dependent protease ClpP protease subunit